MKPLLSLSLLGGALLVTASAVRAADLRSEVTSLFELGGSARTWLAAQSQYEQLRNAHANDARVCYAYALAALKHKQYRLAAEAIDEVVRLQPEFLPAWKSKIWLAIVTGEPTAMPAMERLAELLGSESPGLAATPEYCQAADFLGRTCGYVVGPGQGKLGHSSPAAAEAQIFARLTKDQRAAFLEGRRAVLSHFSALAKDIQSLRQQAAAMQASQRERQEMKLESESQYVANERSQYEQRRAEIRRAGSEEKDRITQAQQGTLGAYTQACAAASSASQSDSVSSIPTPANQAAQLGTQMTYQNVQYLDAEAQESEELSRLARQQKRLISGRSASPRTRRDSPPDR